VRGARRDGGVAAPVPQVTPLIFTTHNVPQEAVAALLAAAGGLAD
jgi:hypothetical protein